MSQQICPLFGEYANDQAISRAAGTRPGITAKPVLVTTGGTGGTTLSLSLGVNPDLGFWAWRTPWTKDGGSVQIVEDATVAFGAGLTRPAAGLKRHVLLVGRWKWIAGQIGSDGKPLGTLTAAQKATYSILQGSDSATPSDPSIPLENPPVVILARVVIPDTGDITIEWPTDTMMDMLDLVRSLAGKHNRSGKEVHDGAFEITHAPINPQDPVRLQDFTTLIGSEITLGPGSTADSGYALLGTLAMAWVRGPSTWFTYQTNPIVSINTPISFNKIYTYALSTENSEEVISDNDAWWQLVKAVDSGNTFQAIAQCPGNKGAGGWIRPVLWVIGEPTPHNPTITNVDWNGMALNGQTYPKLLNIQLASVGGIGAITWEIVGGTATAAFLAGYPSIVQVSIGAIGTTTLIVKATDSLGATATKTINITLAAYTQVPLVISSSGYSSLADIYPWEVSVPLASSGGDSPITWSIVAGANTTLPSAAISGSTLTGSAPDAGSYTVQVRATDSSSTPQVVDKTLTITVTTYVESPVVVNPCFENSETYVLMGDWTGKLFADVVPGEMVMGIKESRHEGGVHLIQPTQCMSISRLPGMGGEEDSVLVAGVKATPGHPYGTIQDDRGDWTRARDLKPTSVLVGIRDHLPVAVPAGETTRSTPVQVAANMTTTLQTYFVGATPQGPWRLVHNAAQLDHQCYD